MGRQGPPVSTKPWLLDTSVDRKTDYTLQFLVTNVPIYSIANVTGGGLSLTFRRWATKKTAGSTKNGRDLKPKNLGVKKFGGERVILGNIIVRQRGTRFQPGNYIKMGKDHTLYAMKEGCVKFERHKLSGRKWVRVEPKEGHLLHPAYSSVDAIPKQKTTA
ncbi:uncharacterized protein LOC114308467 [Camellia sinensis]|uniref:uncharacterized protein LOC114308467 n=1 Tax=Camellia sinensis TaxID=4442 RepID=UPI0010358182|nr:uncharacterized protein LOC114308467 [Camellia sinensis]